MPKYVSVQLCIQALILIPAAPSPPFCVCVCEQWRCYMKHTGEQGVGPPQSWCDPAALGSSVTDEDGSGGSASTGMCRF